MGESLLFNDDESSSCCDESDDDDSLRFNDDEDNDDSSSLSEEDELVFFCFGDAADDLSLFLVVEDIFDVCLPCCSGRFLLSSILFGFCDAKCTSTLSLVLSLLETELLGFDSIFIF